MLGLPKFVLIILFLHACVYCAFCIYGLVGLELKEEYKNSKPRSVAVICCYVAVVLAVFGLIPQMFNTYSQESHDEAVEEAYQQGMDEGYFQGYDVGYSEGYYEGYDDGFEAYPSE